MTICLSHVSMPRAALIVLLSSSAFGCGQTGDLRLPDADETSSQPHTHTETPHETGATQPAAQTTTQDVEQE